MKVSLKTAAAKYVRDPYGIEPTSCAATAEEIKKPKITTSLGRVNAN